MPTAAHKLLGVPLTGGWHATRLIPPDPFATGGFFSVGYEATDQSGARGFLKALDFAKAFGAADPARLLEAMTSAFNFERDTLEACRTRNLSRVVTALAAGTVNIPGYNVPAVPYLVFEMADGDIRRYLSAAKTLDLAWRYRCLHDVATGLRQLHGTGIAHQDLKPSNVLTYLGGAEARVGDLGRASRQGFAGPNDNDQIAGDQTYAPPELLYGHVDPDWERRRLGCDIYHLGGLVTFMFAQTNFTHSLVGALDPALHPSLWKGRYADVLPHVRHAFDRVLSGFEGDALRLAPATGKEVVAIVRQLCEPDPLLRGDPLRRRTAAQYSLERYISRFDALEHRARLGNG